MSLLAKKLIVYDYLIGKIVQRERELSQDSEDDVLFKITSTALMKYLYIVNVLSVSKESKSSLFDLFDNYKAFPHGPVEVDTYYNRNILVNYEMGYDIHNKRSFLRKCTRFTNEQILLFGLESEPDSTTTLNEKNRLDKLIEEYNLSSYKDMVDRVFTLLEKATTFPRYNEVERLIDVTHQDLWNAANYSIDNRLILTNHDLLVKEKKKISDAIGLAA